MEVLVEPIYTDQKEAVMSKSDTQFGNSAPGNDDRFDTDGFRRVGNGNFNSRAASVRQVDDNVKHKNMYDALPIEKGMREGKVSEAKLVTMSTAEDIKSAGVKPIGVRPHPKSEDAVLDEAIARARKEKEDMQAEVIEQPSAQMVVNKYRAAPGPWGDRKKTDEMKEGLASAARRVVDRGDKVDDSGKVRPTQTDVVDQKGRMIKLDTSEAEDLQREYAAYKKFNQPLN